jgi:hypothetical protein
MPFSHNRFDGIVSHFIKESKYHRWLDVGAGSGKYAKMIRAELSQLAIKAHITGVEIEQDYIDKYKLNSRYDKIMNMDAAGLVNVPGDWEGIIIGDVIEHLPKSKGVDLIHYLVYRCKTMILVYPKKRIQGEWNGYKHEQHVSVWCPADWDYFDHRLWEDPASDLVIIDGYIEHEDIPLCEDVRINDGT